MTAFDPQTAWQPYEALLPTEEMASKLQIAARFAGEPLIEIIPSIALLPDGPKLSSLFFATWNLLSEVQLDGESFDFIDRSCVETFRWNLGAAEVAAADGTVLARYETASLLIIHTMNTTSRISYVGVQRELWIASVLRALPSRMVGSRR